MDIKTLRSMRNTDFTKIASEFEKTSNPSYGSADNRYWKLERDKAGNASATIRFLSRTEGDELPWVKMFSHGFKGPNGRWFIENCLTTIDQECPCCAYNSAQWNSVTDEESPVRKAVKLRKRKLKYTANILVVNDPKFPENNGKVFLFSFGKKIFEKIINKGTPKFEDETPVNVFDYWEGANFKIRMTTVDGYPNYDTSEFMSPGPIGTDEEILEIAKQQYSLKEFIDPKNFKSYDELQKKMQNILGAAPIQAPQNEDEEFESPKPEKTKPAPEPAKSKPSKIDTDDDDDDALAFFKSIADED